MVILHLINLFQNLHANFGLILLEVRCFAIKVLSIVPHSAACERLFSSIGIVKSKERNRLTPDSLSMLEQLKHELKKAIIKKQDKPVSESSNNNNNNNSSNSFDENDKEGEEENELIEELNEELEEVTVVQDEISVMEEFFNLTMLENNQVLDIIYL